MDIRSLVDALESQIADPKQGLPEEVFLFVSRLTPMVNVDLLLKNSRNETLLTWREDQFYGPAWHVPGGIVRFKETLKNRISIVAKAELGASVEFNKEPLAITEMMASGRNTRGHFISLLYECRLGSPLDPERQYISGTPRNGEWAWHAGCPDELIQPHQVYRQFIELPAGGSAR